MKSSLLRFLSTLAAISLACNLATPAGPRQATPPEASSVAPIASPLGTATREPFAPVDPTPFISNLAANLRERVASGEWTEEQGLVNTMKALVGEAGMNTVNPSGLEVHGLGASGVVRMARAYIKSGKDQATRAELKRLIGQILPDPETLKRFSRPAGQSSAAHLARPAAQTEVCRSLWADGFPEGSTAVCFEERTVEAGGQTYKIYFPASWAAGDPRRRLFDPTADAVSESVETYSRYGEMPSGTIVFALLPDPEVPDAEAVTTMAAAGASCQMAVLPVGTDAAVDYYKQVIAHEMFHCYQFRNNYAQSALAGADWWVEGTAEYFANVVYPGVNAESGYWSDFDALSVTDPLLDMDYANEVFFQYLANRTGDEGVLALIARMPSSGARSAQLASLAAYPDIEALFHDFARAYLDGKIADPGGGMIASEPGVDRERIFADSHTETITTRSFLLARAHFSFPQGKQQALTEEKPDSLTSAAEAWTTEGSESWAPFPTELAAACDELAYVYVATKASAEDGEEEIRITSTTEDLEGTCDRCVIGRWQMDNTSHWEAFQAVMAGGPSVIELQSMSGSAVGDFTADGKMTITLDNFNIQYTHDIGATHAESTVDANGLFQSDWYTDQASGTLYSVNSTSEPIQTGRSTITINGISTTVEAPPITYVGSVSLYQCSGDTLLIDSFTPAGAAGQYVTWNKIR